MKNTKKIAGIILALVMVIAMALPAFAAQEGDLTGGKITISDAVPGQTYNAYQILYLESYDAASGAHAYKANSAWADWLGTQTDYIAFDGEYVKWVGEKTDERVAAFAKLAREEAANMTADATAVAPAADEGKEYSTVTMEGLKLGYYLVDTSLGSLCSLDTSNPEAKMNEKNEKPTIDKTVKEEATGQYGATNTAKIGDEVEFKIVVHAKKGAQNYVVHDKMTEGLTFKAGSINVAVGDTALTEGTEYTVQTNVNHLKEDSTVDFTCEFEITFAKAYLDTITDNTDITITYIATLNNKATTEAAGNVNEAGLDYGDDSFTGWQKTQTFTYQFELVKTKNDNTVLNGAEFELYDSKTEGTKIDLVKESEGVYRVATADDKGEGFVSAVIEAGRATIKGLDSAVSYFLEETKQPAGYNKLTERTEVTINGANLVANMGEDGKYVDGAVQVINETGTELPTTGGIGTTIFYIVGGILLVGAGVTLVVRKRMSGAKESK